MSGLTRTASNLPDARPGPESDELRKLRETDRKVRSHEQAHLAAAGDAARGGMKLDTKVGPDGKPYAVSGEVSIQVSGGRTPEEALRKSQAALRAALAPADPSPQDMKVAQEARQAAIEARRKMDAASKAKSPMSHYGSKQQLTGALVDLVG